MPAAAAPAKPAVDLPKQQAIVGNLDITATAENVEALFAKYNKPTFRRFLHGGGGVVTFASAKLVAKAIEELNGKVFHGVSYESKGLRVEAMEEKAVDVKEQTSDSHLPIPPESGHDKIIAKGAFGAWHTKRNVLFELNEVHGDFRRVFFEKFIALLEETNDEAYVCRMADYVRWILSKYMFVRVERPRGSKHFVLGYVKCDWVFSFARRFERMRPFP